MDQELKQYLDSNFARMDSNFSRTSASFAQIDARFAEVERRAESLEERVYARIEKVETSLLTAFHGWARPMEVRVSGVATMVLGFDERLALAEQRISELERRRAS